LVIFAALFTRAALKCPNGPQPAAYGHIQTLVDLIDEYPSPSSTEKVLYWGHKKPDVEKGSSAADGPTVDPTQTPPTPPPFSFWQYILRGLVHYFVFVVMGLWNIVRHPRDKIWTPVATFLRTFIEIVTAKELPGEMEENPGVGSYHAGRLIIYNISTT